MRKPLAIAGALMPCLILLPSCAKEPAVVVSSKPLCAAVQPMCTVPEDKFTPATARRLLANEYGRETVCGKPKPCPEGKPTS